MMGRRRRARASPTSLSGNSTAFGCLAWAYEGTRRGNTAMAGDSPGSVAHNGSMLLERVAAVSREVSGTSARLGKVAALASALGEADADEVPMVVAYLSGELPQRQI